MKGLTIRIRNFITSELMNMTRWGSKVYKKGVAPPDGYAKEVLVQSKLNKVTKQVKNEYYLTVENGV